MDCQHFFSFFFLNSVPNSDFQQSGVQLTFSSASFILLLIPSTVFFNSVIVHLCSLKHLALYCIPSVYASILFLRSWIFFTITPIFISLSCSSWVYLNPSSRTYFSAISLYLILCICGPYFQAAGLQFSLVLVPSPLAGEFRLGTGTYPLVGSAGFCPSDRQDCLK